MGIIDLLNIVLFLHFTKHCHRFIAKVAFFHSHAAFLRKKNPQYI